MGAALLGGVGGVVGSSVGHLSIASLLEDQAGSDVSLRWRISLGAVRPLDRVESGEVEYLVVRAPSGDPIAKGGIDYAIRPGTGTLTQLATADELQGQGIGAHLIAVAEGRMRERGVRSSDESQRFS